jgi:diaminopimelate epimerase
MHGLGNDYIYLDCMAGEPANLPELAREMSRRHFGVGADGLIGICPSRSGDFRMRMFNADGSEGEMCGNGIRCVGKYVYDRGLTDKTRLRIETLAGLKTLELHVSGGQVSAVTVEMGVPRVEHPRTLEAAELLCTVTPVDMGNPHAVLFVQTLAGLEIARPGSALECHPAFPNRTNVEFVQVLSPERLRMRVWERGSGETMACGTGAAAAMAAACVRGLCGHRAAVELPGGELAITWAGEGAPLYLTGPAVTVFNGEYLDKI